MVYRFINVIYFLSKQAAENEVTDVKVTVEALTLNQCRTLRPHHATQMIKNLNTEVRLIDVLICQKSILVTKTLLQHWSCCTGLPTDKRRPVKGRKKRSKAAGSGCQTKRLQQPLFGMENKIMFVGTTRCVDKKDSLSVVHLHGIALLIRHSIA